MNLWIVALVSSSFLLGSAAFAQPPGAITLGPVGVAAPAAGWPGMVLLGFALAAFALFRLRNTSGPQRVASALLVCAGLWASGFALTQHAFAKSAICVRDGACFQVNTYTFDPRNFEQVASECFEPLRIIDLELPCDNLESPSGTECVEGDILPPGTDCQTPRCLL